MLHDAIALSAHTPNNDNKWHKLEPHLLAVAEQARTFASLFDAGDLAYAAGLLHDVGKCSPTFQDYLQRCQRDKQNARKGKTYPGGGDHKQAGALLSRALFEGVKVNCLALSILGHHGGMPARSEAAIQTLSPDEEETVREAIGIAQGNIASLRGLPSNLNVPQAYDKNELTYEMFVRMLYSCLVDADSLDTERHFDADKAGRREQTPPLAGVLEKWDTDLQTYQARLKAEAERKAKTDKERNVIRVRAEVNDCCRTAAREDRGVFCLTVPTGGGKTLASLAFALEHARRHGAVTDGPRHLRRIIYAIPYTSIIDQTADVFFEVLGKDAPLLVHHSALADVDAYNESDGSNGDGASAWGRLASQNWDAPLIVTTTVQLFESLFSNKPGRCRKLHNLVNSILILDEAQMLPILLLQPILNALKTLVRHYGLTVVFCTATQPALDEMSPHLRGFKRERLTEIVPRAQQNVHFSMMQRVRYRVEGREQPWNWAAVAAEMKRDGLTQCLTVLNTRAQALEVLATLGDDPSAFHLSTLLCGAHRKAILAEVRRRLAAGEPCRLVATQVVECGCDLDFGKVLRAIGPFDRIIQSAGRCNRNGRQEMGEVVVFFPEKHSLPPREYAIGADLAIDILAETGMLDFDRPDTCEEYFRRLYGRVYTDGKKISPLQKSLDFPATAREFRMIAEDTTPVLVCYEPNWSLFDTVLQEAQQAKQGKVSRQWWRNAQPLLINMYASDVKAQMKAKNLEPMFPEDPKTLYLWTAGYDSSLLSRGIGGVLNDPADPV